jgi:S1-C subfamily serine protease
VRLDADVDLSVSARHCEFFPNAGEWSVRDLGSRNGTYINGHLAAGTVMLRAGDVVMLGEGGPEIVFEQRIDVPVAAAEQPREDTGARVRTAVRRETRRLRVAAIALIALGVLAVGALFAADRRERATWEAERIALQLRVDSLIQTGRVAETALQQEVTGLNAALRASENRLLQLQAEIGASRGDEPRVEALEQQLLSASAALRRQQLAASLDYSLIQRRNRSAIAMIWVEYTDGSRVTGTAFAVRADGLLVTNRHLVSGADGSRAVRRIVVRFSDSDQAFPGRVAAVAPAWDLAALRVSNVIGEIPTIGALNVRSDTIQAGAPVALIGFPLGGEPDPDGASARRVARPVVSAGLVVANDARALAVQGLGAAGGSGSPIIDARGEVLAILYGGRSDAGVQLLFGVPAGAVAEFLSQID